jgi:outer membrane protein assembly factor BamB
MKSIHAILLSLLLSIGLLPFTVETLAETRVTITLLPDKAVSEPTTDDDRLLKISADGSSKPTSEARLGFDLSAIPGKAKIQKVTLRVVPEANGKAAQKVNIYVRQESNPSGFWSIAPGEAEPKKRPVSMQRAIVAGEKLSLRLSSVSSNSEWKYYSISEKNPSSFKPRLIIEYEVPEIRNWQNTERTDWKFYPRPASVKPKPLLDKVDIISNPVFYKDAVYLFAKPTSESTQLYALNFNGRELWEPIEIKITPASHAVVSHTGILYSVGEDHIALYDLKNAGERIEHKELKDLKLTDLGNSLKLDINNPPTLGADGSLYIVPSGSGYVYGLNPNLKELWRYPSGVDDKKIDKEKIDKASRIVLSPDAQRYAYVMIKSGKNIKGVRINTADGEIKLYEKYVGKDPADERKAKEFEFGNRYTDFHRPLVVKGPKRDYVFLSAYSNSDGILAAYSGPEAVWSTAGPVSSPIADRVEKNVVVVQNIVQNSRLRAYEKFNGAESCHSEEDTELKATSNLVMDGDDNVYFWNNDTFYGYTKDCKRFLMQELKELPKELELLFAPDGTLYAFIATTLTQSGKQSLYSITPSQPTFTLDSDNVQTDTIYSADTIRVANNLQLGETTNIILKAGKISFGKPFTVKKGARLTCKIGF